MSSVFFNLSPMRTDFSPEKLQELREKNAVDHVEAIDLGLEDIFKDFVKGKRAGL